MRETLGIRRRSTYLLLLAILFLLPTHTPPAGADNGGLQLTINNLAINSDFVSFDLLLEGAFTEGGRDALLKGFATHMTYTVELWRERGYWFDKLALTRTLTMKVTYDLWAERYIVHFRRDRLAKFDTIEGVRDATCNLEGLKLIEGQELDSDKEYYIAVRAHLRPLTIEEIGELEDWLSGDVPSGGKGGGILSIPGYLMRILIGTTGVTDRSTLAKSEVFTVEAYEEGVDEGPAEDTPDAEPAGEDTTASNPP